MSSQPTLFPAEELPSMQSAAVSPVRTLARLASELVSKIRDLASGSSTRVSLANFDPDTSSWRTSQACLVSGWETFSESWPRSGIMLSGIAYPLPPSAPLTEEIASGLLPTPVTIDSGSRFNKSDSKGAALRPTLGAMAKFNLWPTPTVPNGGRTLHHVDEWRGSSAYHNGKKVQVDLAQAVRMWPTPTAINDTGGAALCKWGGAGSRAKLKTMVSPEELNGALNPTWVEWLMGFPLGWTDCGPSETRSFRKSRS